MRVVLERVQGVAEAGERLGGAVVRRELEDDLALLAVVALRREGDGAVGEGRLAAGAGARAVERR